MPWRQRPGSTAAWLVSFLVEITPAERDRFKLSSLEHRMASRKTALACLALVFASAISPQYASPVPYLFRSPGVFVAGVTPPFNPPGGRPFAAASGDLNKDGHPDLVVAAYSDFLGNDGMGELVSVLLGTPYPPYPPLFHPKVSYTTGQGPDGVVLADLDNDSDLDVITANPGPTPSTTGTVSVLLNDGTGALGTHADTPLPGASGPIAVGDVNGDGVPDVVAGIASPPAFAILLGDGAGFLTAPTLFPTGAAQMRQLVLADVTGGGGVDVVTANGTGNTVTVFAGNGLGGFTTVGSFSAGTAPIDLAVAELDGDPISDLAVLAQGSNTVSVLLGAGGGSFPVFSTLSLPQTSPIDLALGDINRDGGQDIVVSFNKLDTDHRTLAILHGNSNGTFQPALAFHAGPGPGQVVLQDFSGDGLLDVALPTRGEPSPSERTHTVGVLLNDGAGGVLQTLHAPIATSPSGFAVADFNCDGKDDVAVSYFVAGTVEVLLGNGDGTYSSAGTTAVSQGISFTLAGDVNRDGKPDLLFWDEPDIKLCLGIGNGTFLPPDTKASGHLIRPGSLTEMNRDGLPDLVTYDALSNAVAVLLQNAAGDFVPVGSGPITGNIVTGGFAVGDWNRDGRPDVAAAKSDGLIVFQGSGNGFIGAPVPLGAGKWYRAVCAGDFDRDGDLDLAAAGSNLSPDVDLADVFLGNGTGGFDPPITHATMDWFNDRLESWDANRDGFPDLVVGGHGALGHPDGVGVFLGYGTGQFLQRSDYVLGGPGASGDLNGDAAPDMVGIEFDETAPPNGVSYVATLLASPVVHASGMSGKTDYGVGPSPGVVAIGDLNRDGKLDVVASSGVAGRLNVCLGIGDGTLGPGTAVPQAQAATQIGLADLNRDGTLDLVTLGSSLPALATVMLGTGTGAFGSATAFNVGATAQEFEIHDVNRDGSLDLVVSDPGTSAIRVLPGDGTGGFGSPLSSTLTGTAYDIDLEDMNCDGRLDVVVAHGDIAVMLGNGLGQFGSAIATPLPGGKQSRRLSVADFNRDGRPDVAALSGGPVLDFLSVLTGAGNGGFSSILDVPLGFGGRDVQVGHAKGDGDWFAYVTGATGVAAVIPRNADGSWGPGVSYPTGAGPEGLALGDLNRDALPDVVTANLVDATVSVLLHGGNPITGVEVVAAPRVGLEVAQNYPNPFNPSTTIRFKLAAADHVRVAVFDVAGRRVATLLERQLPPGEHVVEWAGINRSGFPVGSGVYFYRVTTAGGRFSASRKMVLTK
jgi:trimeric autotransporter adhesin